MTKTLNQIIFFPPPKSEYLFQQHWESEYFLRKNHTPLLQVKWSVPNLVEIWLPKKFTALYLQPKYQNTTIISIYNSIIITTLIFIFHGNSEPDTIYKQGRLNSIIGPREKQCTGAPAYTNNNRNKNVNGR
jgi:hypothetical protein